MSREIGLPADAGWWNRFRTGVRVEEFDLARQNISFPAPPKRKGKAYKHARKKSTVGRGHVGRWPSWMHGYSNRR
jgi:hypothetical protein